MRRAICLCGRVLEQIAKLRRRDRHHSIPGKWPDEAPALQPLREQAHALAVVPQYLDQPAAPAPEHEQVPLCGLRCNVSCTSTARPSKPLRMSVWPVASHTRTSLWIEIIVVVRPLPAR